MTMIKLFLMTHKIPCIISNDNAMVYYTTVAKITGRKLNRRRNNFYTLK